ncbi:DUF4232 domain-containing protein [Kitasatospora sp. CM 4170]|uniref:DUF4232 domain-containing protein n=1 Tax=Kitasatospora aburaviensis TaxID=67265 RepID=A0ABW1ET83_9ACTN|nr:DUF4232 domain-containing protein [Kitasatospora sp. CM 4170]WNM44821.1 DUF4232 domain-containing protein [Kitasatospora sp. CM 4170]
MAAAAAAAVAAALVAGCGSVAATTAAPGTSGSAGPCGTPPGSAAPSGQGGVRITAAGPACAEYEVTNPGSEPSDVTVVFSRLSADGGALDNVTRTVPAIAPGATVTATVDLGGRETTRAGTGPRVKILRVRRVPSAEAPQPAGPCPASGLRLYADEGDAAMGLRVVGLHLRNCGSTTVTVNGYPKLQLLDLEHRPIDGVRILPGGAEITTGTGADDPPQEIALQPGQGARSTLVWRNTTQDGAPVNAPYVRVRAFPDAAPVMVTPELDLGTTGRLGVGAWTREGGSA